MCRIEETNEGGFTVFIDNKYMIVRRFEEYMDVMISKNTVWWVELCIANVPLKWYEFLS